MQNPLKNFRSKLTPPSRHRAEVIQTMDRRQRRQMKKIKKLCAEIDAMNAHIDARVTQ